MDKLLLELDILYLFTGSANGRVQEGGPIGHRPMGGGCNHPPQQGGPRAPGALGRGRHAPRTVG